MNTCRIGLFGVGLDTYWPQFGGLKARLENHLEQVRKKLARPGVEIVDLGLIDSVPKAFEAGHRFRREDVDLIFLHVTTYALSATVLPVVQRGEGAGHRAQSQSGTGHGLCKLQSVEESHVDDWGMACQLQCLLDSEIANVFNRCRAFPFPSDHRHFAGRSGLLERGGRLD